MIEPRFELFDHTADIGVRVFAPSLAALVTPSTEGLYDVIGELATKNAPVAWAFELFGEEPALLLRDYLAEVLHLFDARRQRLTAIDVHEFTPRRLALTAQSRAISAAHSNLEREVKAVTYHELAIRPTEGGFEATYIVDI